MRHEVAICIPAGDHCATMFAYDLARLVGYTVAKGEDVGVKIFVLKTAYLPSSRLQLARAAVETGCTHLLWLDSDMRFPKDALLRLLAHEKPIVAAGYSTRRMPLRPTAEDEQGPHYTANSATGLEPVQYVGMGCMLTSADVFRALEQPWFAVPYSRPSGDFVGEDVFFCDRARQAGFEILLDAQLTNEVKHLGEWEYTNQQANEWRAMQEREATPKLEIVSA